MITDLLCGLAWRILWKWWPDRVVHIVPINGHSPFIKEVTITRALQDQWIYKGKAVIMLEKLDHAGRSLALNQEDTP